MDLDKIKKTWQDADIRPSIGEEKIQKMLSNEGKGAFNRLLFYEQVGIAGLILLIPVAFLVFSKHPPIIVFYVISILIGLVWQIYKVRKLKSINIAEIGITEISGHFYWYRKALMKEFIIGCIWFLVFALLFSYFNITSNTNIPINTMLLILAVSFLIAASFTIILYKTLYWNNLKKIENSIKEIEEFERDNH